MKPLGGALVFTAVAALMASCSSDSTVSSPQSTHTAPGSKVSSAPATSPSGGLFSGAQPWNVDVSAEAKSDRSDAILAALNGAGGWGNDNVFQTDFAIPVFTADSNTPRMQVVGIEDYCGGGPDCDDVPAEMPVPEGAYIEGSENLTCDITGEVDGQGDCHLLVADTAGRKLYEVYQANQVGDQISAQGFFTWDLDKQYTDSLRGLQCTSADAAGFPIAALTPTADEVAAGDIAHALRFILPNDRMKAEVFVPPATHAGGPENANADAPPYGVNFRLKADFDDSSFNESQRVVVAALKKYGMYLSDGGDIALTFADDKTTTAKWADLGIDAKSFSAITVDDFEVVDHGAEIPLTYDCVRAS
jgi:hypothetical protein